MKTLVKILKTINSEKEGDGSAGYKNKKCNLG